jgi:hypothetical protein
MRDRDLSTARLVAARTGGQGAAPARADLTGQPAALPVTPEAPDDRGSPFPVLEGTASQAEGGECDSGESGADGHADLPLTAGTTRATAAPA